MKRWKTHITLFTLLFFTTINSWSQCAMCRAVLESEAGQRQAEGINNGITYLMIIPYILIVIVGYQVFKKKK